MFNMDRIRSQEVYRGTTPTKVHFNYIAPQQQIYTHFSHQAGGQIGATNVQFVPISQNQVQ